MFPVLCKIADFFLFYQTKKYTFCHLLFNFLIGDVSSALEQDEPLQIRVMDYDTYSANDAIGKVYIDLNPLLITHEADRKPINTSTNNPNDPPKTRLLEAELVLGSSTGPAPQRS